MAIEAPGLYRRLARFLRRHRRDPMVRFWRDRGICLEAAGVRKLLVPVYYLRSRRLIRRSGAQVPYSRDISPFEAPHGLTGVFISGGAKLGPGCTIFQQVTIGSSTLSDSKQPGAPVIGKNVYIGAGAKIIGGVHIGDGVRIGANCVVATDVPDNATVVLPRPRVILHDAPRENRFEEWQAFSEQKESK